jgi:hypothetical protein
MIRSKCRPTTPSAIPEMILSFFFPISKLIKNPTKGNNINNWRICDM